MDGSTAVTRVVGAGAMVAAAVSAVVMVAGGLPRVNAAARVVTEEGGSLFGPGQVLLIAGLALLGAALLLGRYGGWTGPAVAAAGLVAAELAGTGVVSVRRWGLFVGAGYARGHVVGWQQGRVLAAVMGLACAAVATACLVWVLRRRGGWHLRRAAVAVPAALAMAVLAPLSVETPWNDRSDMAAWAAMFALPFAVGLVMTAVVPRPVGLSLLVTVAVSILVAPLGASFLETMAPSGPATPAVLIAAGLTAAVLVVTGAGSDDDRREPTVSQRARRIPSV